MRERALALGLVWLMAACDAPERPSDTTVVRDSSGVRIVETTGAERFSTAWEVGQAADWSVGQLEGDPDHLLSRVVGALQLPDGRILIGNGGTNEIRLYGSDGTLVRTIGGEGQGPGEFEYLRELRRCDEQGFVAFDLSWQLSAFDTDGNLLQEEVLTTPDGFTPYNLACGSGGRVLLLGWGVDRSAPRTMGFYPTWDRLLLTTVDGEVQTDFGTWLVSERIVSASGSRPHPAGRATVFDIHGGLVFVGSGERFEIQVRSFDGAVRSLIRGPAVDLRVTDSIKAVYLEASLRGLDASRQRQVRSMVADWDWPESQPAYTALRVDSDGTVWTRAYSADPRSGEVWSLFDTEQGYLGDLRLQPRQTLLEAGGDYVLVLSRDELDVERVERRSLVRVPLTRNGSASRGVMLGSHRQHLK